LKKFQEGGTPLKLEPPVLEYLKTLSWPGNIRELANVIQHMMTFCTGNKISMKDLPPSLLPLEKEEKEVTKGEIDLPNLVSELEKKWIINKLEESDWNKEKARKLLGITRRMLIDRIKKYDISMPPETKKS
jgi:DNA-binding NtrC family response regulator